MDGFSSLTSAEAEELLTSPLPLLLSGFWSSDPASWGLVVDEGSSGFTVASVLVGNSLLSAATVGAAAAVVDSAFGVDSISSDL